MPSWRFVWHGGVNSSQPCYSPPSALREVLRAEVRRTVDSETEVDEEMRELLRVLATG